jgi:hypothetical protein
MSILSDLNPVTGLVNGVGKAVSSVARVFVGDKGERDAQESGENMATLNQFAAEFGRGKNWFDSLIDGVNRLPRPFLALGVLFLMVWAPIDPIGFAGAMNAYALVPDWLAALFAVIVGFYFAARHLEQRLKFTGPSAEQVAKVIANQKALTALKAVETTDNMADESKPLSDEAIEKWNEKGVAR